MDSVCAIVTIPGCWIIDKSYWKQLKNIWKQIPTHKSMYTSQIYEPNPCLTSQNPHDLLLRWLGSTFWSDRHSHSHWNDENYEKHKTRDPYLFKTFKIIEIGPIAKKLWWFKKCVFPEREKNTFRIRSLEGL